MRRFFGIFLMFLGFCSFFFADNSWLYVPIGIALLIYGANRIQSAPRRWRRRRRRHYPAGTYYNNTPPAPMRPERYSNYVYDSVGVLYDVSSWEETVAGMVYVDRRTGMVAERDSEGYLHIV